MATGEGNLVCLDITENRLQERSHVKLTGEVSCIDITPLDDGDRSQLAAVGTWDMQVGCPPSSSALADSAWPVVPSKQPGCASAHSRYCAPGLAYRRSLRQPCHFHGP